jgi:N-acetylneuraminate lyase
MKPSRPLAGLVAAVHTPFQPDGSLHLEVVETQAAHLRANGIEIAFVGGSTGEGHSLSLEERRALARRLAEVVRGTGLGIVVHVGANCLADSRALAEQAEELGAVAISALAPSYFRPRLPIPGLSPGQVAELRCRLEALGFFDWIRTSAQP